MIKQTGSPWGSQFAVLLDHLYAAATEPSEWPQFLCRAAELTGSEATGVLLHDFSTPTGSGLWFYGVPEEFRRQYGEWADRNVFLQALAPVLRSGYIVPNAPIPKSEILRSPFHAEFFSRYLRVLDACGVCIFLHEPLMAFFACHRAATKPDFGPDEHAVLRALAPHLQRAVSIHRRLGNLELERAASHRILDNLRAAVVFLDESGKVIAHNDAAERIFRQEDGLILTRLERLRAARSSDDGSLQRFIRDACATGTGKGMSAGGTLPIHRPSGRPYAVIVAPLALRQWPLLERRPAAVVFVSDPEDLVKPLAERLAPLFGLTPAEARLAAALAARQSLEDYAEQASLTIGTARWTLKRVLEKTGCRRQSELVHLLATSVAGLIRE